MVSVGEELAHRDLILNQIDKEIKNQHSFIFNQLRDIEKKREKNQYLNNIYDDYVKFKEYIVKEKSEQKLLLQNLLSYLEKSKTEEFYASRLLDQLDKEEKNVFNKLNQVKKDLSELLNDKNNSD
tara:strand:+ start:177 stop:551 length:375 start_codon:yes stop_codon:yes gene_type:complete